MNSLKLLLILFIFLSSCCTAFSDEQPTLSTKISSALKESHATVYSPGQFPFVDIKQGGDVEHLTDLFRDLLNSFPENTFTLDGELPFLTKMDVENFHRMLVETTAIVRTKMREGDSKKMIQKAGLGEEWMSWGRGSVSTEEWINMIYESIQNEE
jgi:hypothetical protein